MGLFDGIEDAEIGKNRQYLRPGRYVLRVDEMVTGKSRKNQNFFVCSAQVMVVLDIAAAASDMRGPHREGDQASIMFMESWDSFLGSVKGLVACVAQADPEEVTKEVCALATSADQPFRGTYFEVDAKNIPREKKEPFTKVVPIRVWDVEEVKAKMSPVTAKKLGVA